MDEKKKTPKRATGNGSARRAPAGTAKPKATAKDGTVAKARKSRASLPPPAPTDPTTRRRESSKHLALEIALAALDKKAERVEIVDIAEKVDYADYLVVMTGRSDRQVVAIAQAIEEAIGKRGLRATGREGVQQGHWVLIDVADVVVHVFLDEARKYYDLEGLWLDAPRVPTPTFVPPARAASDEPG